MRSSLLLVVFLLVGCGKGDSKPDTSPSSPGKVDAPTASGDGPDWTYKELLDKFKANGYPNAKMAVTNEGQMYRLKPSENLNFTTIEASIKSGARWQDFKEPVFTCEKMESAKAAHEAEGHHEKGAWAWGRYYFRGSEETLAMVKKVLGK